MSDNEVLVVCVSTYYFKEFENVLYWSFLRFDRQLVLMYK